MVKNMTCHTISITKKEEEILNSLTESLSLTKSAVIRLALQDFIIKMNRFIDDREKT